MNDNTPLEKGIIRDVVYDPSHRKASIELYSGQRYVVMGGHDLTPGLTIEVRLNGTYQKFRGK